MADTWFAIEYVLTAPGRWVAWFNWALPWGPGYHDDELRDSRRFHWLMAGATYLGLYQSVQVVMERGGFELVAANFAIMFGVR
jgi:hypothetical protein